MLSEFLSVDIIYTISVGKEKRNNTLEGIIIKEHKKSKSKGRIKRDKKRGNITLYKTGNQLKIITRYDQGGDIFNYDFNYIGNNTWTGKWEKAGDSRKKGEAECIIRDLPNNPTTKKMYEEFLKKESIKKYH